MGSCCSKPESSSAVVAPYSSPQKKQRPKDASPVNNASSAKDTSPQKKLASVRLYGTELCPRTARIRIALEFKGVSAQVFWLNAEDDRVKSKQLLSYMLPADGNLPILQDEDQCISGSADDILDYIETKYPNPSLLLGNAQMKNVTKWVAYVRDKFSPLIMDALYKADPLTQKGTTGELEDAFTKLDHALAKNGSKGPYFMGDQFSLVDVYLIPFLLLVRPLSYFQGFDISSEHSHLISYSKRMTSFSFYAPIRVDTDRLQMSVGRVLMRNAPPPLLTMTVLQHYSMLSHLAKLVQTVDELIIAAKQSTRIVDPVKGSIAMQIRRFSTTYGLLLDFMLEHAQMEERVIFPALEKADRGITKSANQSHAKELPLMNGIKEDLKAVLALGQGSQGRSEVLITVSNRLRALKEHTIEHFREEETELLPLLNAAGVGWKQQASLVGRCVSIMESSHTPLFPFLLSGLPPHQIHQYVDLLQKCLEDGKDVPLATMVGVLKHADEYESIWCVVKERFPALASLG